MPLLRAQKEDLVARLTEELQNSRVALVFGYTALDMKANDTLRTRAFVGGAKIKMISNNLLELILKNLGLKLDLPARQLALAYGFNDEVEAAKTLIIFAKETETLDVLGGWIDGNFFDVSQIITLASLPGRDALQAQLVGRLHGLIGGLAYTLNFPIQKLAYVIEAVKSTQPLPAVDASKDEAPTEIVVTPTEPNPEVAVKSSGEESINEVGESEEVKNESK